MTRWWVSCPRCCGSWFPFATEEDRDRWVLGHALAAPNHPTYALEVEVA